MRGLTVRGDGPPPYEQVRDGVRRLIDRGSLLPGDRVPTVRGLAADLGLAPNTVARAYRALEEGGWLVGRGRTGTFVADDPPHPASDPQELLREAADRYLRRAAHLGYDHASALAVLTQEVPPRA